MVGLDLILALKKPRQKVWELEARLQRETMPQDISFEELILNIETPVIL